MKGVHNFLPSDYPRFWAYRGIHAELLRPLSLVYRGLGWLRTCWITPAQVAIPVVCIGNLSIGGVGKTPTVMALAKALRGRGIAVQILAHSYGGSLKQVTRVDPARHLAAEVGDEALLLAQVTATWIGRDRVAAAYAAQQTGAELLLLDDGWQNPSLHKDAVVVVINAEDPFGNGYLLPAGPLRQPQSALCTASAVIAIGAEVHPDLSALPVIHARRLGIWGHGVEHLHTGGEVFAFCALGRSGQFGQTVQQLCAESGLVYRGLKGYGDHHPWDQVTFDEITAAAGSAQLVTSAKDWQRLPPQWQQSVSVITLKLEWSAPQNFATLVKKIGNLTTLSR
ncbi:MAG: tetraacyldisaccharide 4'-kinase [Alphaproteobacteria bacterium]|nr:tetraacyldisaccharide 4'-kinase [Alphaproteobacteria bacterium]